MPGKKILMVIAPEGFQDIEYGTPKKVFESAGAEVVTASKGVEEAKGKLGGTAKVDIDVSDADASDYDAVVFVGGPGADVYFDDADAHRLAKDAKVAAAICIAPSTLANAGVLEGKKATSFPSQEENLKARGADYTGEPVTVDGSIITGNGPDAAEEFGKAVLKALE